MHCGPNHTAADMHVAIGRIPEFSLHDAVDLCARTRASRPPGHVELALPVVSGQSTEPMRKLRVRSESGGRNMTRFIRLLMWALAGGFIVQASFGQAQSDHPAVRSLRDWYTAFDGSAGIRAQYGGLSEDALMERTRFCRRR
jgi:hypothetical protein